ncbi:MAG TPA: hypothetical protein VG498_18550, partial [Terriglobales bacterium]|nr:hypothetical protein [Terriglobales bacterium]
MPHKSALALLSIEEIPDYYSNIVTASARPNAAGSPDAACCCRLLCFRLRETGDKSMIIQKMPALLCVFLLGTCSAPSWSQNTTTTVPPIIDVHVHAMEESFPGGPMCPNESKFLASDPKTKEAPIGWSQEDCTPKLYP